MRLPRSLGPDSFEVHHIWRDSIGESVINDRFPNRGVMDCAVDVCLPSMVCTDRPHCSFYGSIIHVKEVSKLPDLIPRVWGRLTRLGPMNCDKLLLIDAGFPPESVFTGLTAIFRS